MTAYEEHILQARDVCANCHRQIRVEAIGKAHRQDDWDTIYERHQQTTSVEYGPSDAPPRSQGTFCTCGVEDHRVQDRLWSDGDDRCLRSRRVKDLIKATVETLEAKDVDLDRRRFVQLSLQYYRDHHDLDDALDDALVTAIQIEVASSANRSAAAD